MSPAPRPFRVIKLREWCSALILAAFSASGAFPLTIAPAGPYLTGGTEFRTSGVAIADFDSDGIPDLPVTNYGPSAQPPFGNIAVLWGNGALSFTAPQVLREEITGGLLGIDVDQDGFPDLIFWNGTGTRIYWGNGTRTPAVPQLLTPNPSGGVTIADINNDGRLDLLSTEYNTAEVAIYYNQGMRAFSVVRYFAGTDVNSPPAVGDLDGQNGVDIVVTHFWSNNLSVLLANGSGGFLPPATQAAGQLPSGVAIGEFTGDAFPDVVYARRGCFLDADATCPNDGVTLLPGNGLGGLGAAQDFTVGEGPTLVLAIDLDRDGRLDVALTNFNSNSVSILHGQVGGGLTVLGPYPVDRGPVSLAIGDIDLDGCTDIATANWRSESVSVLRVTDCTPAPTPTRTPSLTAVVSSTATPTVPPTTTPTTTPTITSATTPTLSVTPTPAAAYCDTVPRSGCSPHSASLLMLRNSGNDAIDSLRWSWSADTGTVVTQFGNPVVGTSYALCLYDASLGTPVRVMEIDVPAGGTCGGRPCWKATGTRGFRFKDRDASAGGIRKIRLKATAEGRGGISVSGKGVNLPLPGLPLTQDPDVTIQIVNSTGVCWEARFSTPADTNFPEGFTDRTN